MTSLVNSETEYRDVQMEAVVEVTSAGISQGQHDTAEKLLADPPLSSSDSSCEDSLVVCKPHNEETCDNDIAALLSNCNIPELESTSSFVSDLVGDGSDSCVDWALASTRALLQLVQNDHLYFSQDSTETVDDRKPSPTRSTSCNSIPDAELIHDFFLQTTNMISYKPIAELGGQPTPDVTTTLISCPHRSQTTQPQQSEAPQNTYATSSERKENSGATTPMKSLQQSLSKDAEGQSSDDVQPLREKTKTSIDHAQQNSLVISEVKVPDQSNPPTKPTNDAKRPQNNLTSASDPGITSAVDLSNLQTTVNSRTRELASGFGDDVSKNLVMKSYKTKTKICTKEDCPKDEDSSQEVFDSSTSLISVQSQDSMSSAQVDAYSAWSAACKAVADKVNEESMLTCALTLLLKVWEEYLSLTLDDVREKEIENARELNLCDEVVEMLEDKDRYVWQLIEEMEPRNFSMNVEI